MALGDDFSVLAVHNGERFHVHEFHDRARSDKARKHREAAIVRARAFVCVRACVYAFMCACMFGCASVCLSRARAGVCVRACVRACVRLSACACMRVPAWIVVGS